MRIDNSEFKDNQNRTLMLRGVNLGGSSKVPFTPDGATYRKNDFFNHRNISFVGRPFPLKEAHEHFSRLREWGMTFIRLLITWEAIEHDGPGIYDNEYLDYIEEVVRVAGEYGLDLFVDPHQDVWSRFTGGDGAPGWTLEAVGLDMKHFCKNGAAVVHNQVGEKLPKMIWPTNAAKFACSTMFTLFFGGNDFAPQVTYEGVSIQDYLQDHYIKAIVQVVKRLKKYPHVIGYDTLNEPSAGYIGIHNLNQYPILARIGECPTPFQGMLLADGNEQEVEIWKLGLLGMQRKGTRLMNTERERAWMEGKTCIWRQHGVWDYDKSGKGVLIKPDYFGMKNGKEISFANDYLKPFIRRFADAIRSIQPDTMLFIEGDPNGIMPTWEKDRPANLVNATHWYDDITLMLKNYIPFLTFDVHSEKFVFGRKNVTNTMERQLSQIKQTSMKMGNIPSLVGEFGIPFDMQNKKAYRTGNFKPQIEALNASYQAVEANLLNGTLWNYTADNSNARGDQWNDEDLSIFSRDQQVDPNDINSGARAAKAFIRPYPIKTAGKPEQLIFDQKSGVFIFEFVNDPSIDAPTELFVPRFQFPHGYNIQVSDGFFEKVEEKQLLLYIPDKSLARHQIKIIRR